MIEQKGCQGCSLANKCRDAYRQVGEFQGPCVFFKVIKAFLFPIAVFIAGLVFFKWILSGVIDSEKFRMVLGLVLALTASFSCILIIKSIRSYLKKDC